MSDQAWNISSFANPWSVGKITRRLSPLGIGDFILMSSIWARIKFRCRLHMGGSWNPQTKEVSPASGQWMGSNDILGWKVWGCNIQGVNRDEEPMEKGQRTTAQSSPRPFSTSHSQSLFPKLEAERKAYSTWNLKERFLAFLSVWFI